MSQDDPTLPDIDPVEEELVAYLDDELEPEHRARVEHRLAEDRRYRDKLRHMQQSWDMLDLLGRADPDEGFTRTTVQMVALKATEDVQEQTKSARRQGWVRRLFIVAGSLICAALAYGIVSWFLAAPDRQLVQDLPVIEHLDEYNNAVSVEFLQSLEQHGLFAPEGDDAR